MLLALPLVGLLYANSLRAPFQFDDRHAIVENAPLQTAAQDWSWWGPQASAVGAGHFRPVTFFTYAVNLRAGGLDPFGFHLVNVGLHWASTVALMGVLWLLVGRALPAVAGGLVFAVTPANSEAVNYIAARSSLLVGLWSAVALAGYILMRRAQTQGLIRRATLAGIGSLCAWALAMASKETAVVVPLVMACYDLGWSRRLGWRARVIPYAVVVGLAAGYFLTSGYYRILWAVATGATPGERGVWANLWSQSAAFPIHAAVFAWPFSLNALRDVPIHASPRHPAVIVGLTAVLATCAVGARWLVRASDRRRPVGLLLLWWVITLLPTMLYPLHALFQEHRDYLPGMALAGIAGIAVSVLADRTAGRPIVKWAAIGAGVAVVSAWGVATAARNVVWTDSLALWSDTAAKSPNHAVARVNLGTEHARRGDVDSALAEYQAAIRAQPDYAVAYYNVGMIHVGRGDYVQARPALERAVELAPGSADSLAALGSVYAGLGDLARAQDALVRAGAALDRRPHQPATRLNVAEALLKTGNIREAVRNFQAVVAQEGDRPSFLSAKAYVGLGMSAERVGRPADALAAYATALKITPDLDEARFNRANVLMTVGRVPEATAAYEELLARDPKFFQAYFNLGLLYERAGKTDAARQAFGAFLRESPDSPAYASARRYAAAKSDGAPSSASARERGP
ncbi:MAG: tetratricopeptide repeat protein [Nitrospirota bacterium]